MNRTLFAFLICLLVVDFSSAQDLSRFRQDAKGLDLTPLERSVGEVRSASKFNKLDAHARQIVIGLELMNKQRTNRMLDEIDDFISTHRSGGRTYVDVLVEMATGASTRELDAAGAQIRTRIGDIVVARVPVERLAELDAARDIMRVEASIKRRAYNEAARAETGVDLVHAGTGLPRAFRGEGVVVGVLDTGVDATHPDFSTVGGTRIQYLLEYTQDGGQKEWTKAQIDADPTAVTQRDGDGGGGHGTHVTGTAAGGGRFNALMAGVAPASDIIFVKGVRDPDSDGGFGDTDVIDGTDYIFRRAEEMGKPAVVNLSLGGNWGPLDGTSLYEQALSSLTGPGRIIVAAAGNEGFTHLHAGGMSEANIPNQTIVHPDGSGDVFIGLWYESGTIDEVNVAVLDVIDGIITPVALSGWVPAGSFMNPTPLEHNGEVAGYVFVDAETTSDPQNGDGFVHFMISNNENATIDISSNVWAIYSRGTATGQVDLWVNAGEFQSTMLGYPGVTEMPGNVEQTVGAPATAEKVIAVGSYVTTNTWTNIDGGRSEWMNPDVNNPGYGVVPMIGQPSYFSSKGPTRDGRRAPVISAPGELVFSAMSSHLTEGVGYDRNDVLLGGRYVGMQGTSMASPHAAGVVALMLQANPTLDADDVIAILEQTARADAHTGPVPNNKIGAGRIDAQQAVLMAARAPGGGSGGGGGGGEAHVQVDLRNFDAAGQPLVFAIDRVYPIDSGFVAGTNLYLDRGKASAFRLPAAKTTALLDEVRVWFIYRQAGTDQQAYAIEIYDGDGSTGPVGAPLARKEFAYGHVGADDDMQTAEQATVHRFDAPVTVGSSFFVSVDFGEYGISRAGDLAIGTSDFAGSRVAEVWDRLSNGAWANTSDAWSFGGTTGADGLQLWIEAGARVAASVSTEDDERPTTVVLNQNFPNPFNPQTSIGFSLPQNGRVRLTVYDVLGRHVATVLDGLMSAGAHLTPFDASHLSSGLYLYRLETPAGTVSRTMTVLK